MNKMKKVFLISLVVTFLIAFIFISVKILGFKLFDVEKKSLGKIVVNDEIILDINIVETGTTTNNVIQIKKIYSNGSWEILGSFENYNYLENYHRLSDSTIQLVMNDTSYHKNKPDTVILKIN